PLVILDNPAGPASKTVQITLDTPTGAALAAKGTTATYTINQTDPNITFAVASDHGNEGTTANLVVNLSKVLNTPVTVHYAVTGGTAKSGVNFNLKAGTLTIPANSVTASIPLVTLDDHLSTGGKTVQVTLSAPKGATLGATAV